jgi:hypothetical protein
MKTELEVLLLDLLAHIDFEIEQRKTGGNDEDYADLQKLSDRGHRMVRKLESFVVEEDPPEPMEPEPHCASCGEPAEEGDTGCHRCGGRILYG